MYQTTPLAILSGDFPAAIQSSVEKLTALGIQVLLSFDLQAARASHSNCTCPHHGTDQCNCQLVVLLLYQNDAEPLTLIAHGHDGETELAYVDPPTHQPDQELINQVRMKLNSVRPTTRTGLSIDPHPV